MTTVDWNEPIIEAGAATAAGGDGNWYVLEQLDLDGDGEITWMEFEAMLATDGKMK